MANKSKSNTKLVDWREKYRTAIRTMDTAIATLRLGARDKNISDLEVAMRLQLAKTFASLRKEMTQD